MEDENEITTETNPFMHAPILLKLFEHSPPITRLLCRSVSKIWNKVACSALLWKESGAKNHDEFVERTKAIADKKVQKMVLEGVLKLPLAEKLSRLFHSTLQAHKELGELCTSSVNLDSDNYQKLVEAHGGGNHPKRPWVILLILGAATPQDLLSVFSSDNPKTNYHYTKLFFRCWGIVAQQLNLVCITDLFHIPDSAETYSIEPILSEVGVQFMKEGYATFLDLLNKMPSSHQLRSLLVPNALELFREKLVCLNDFCDLHSDTIENICSNNGRLVLSNKWLKIEELIPLHHSEIKTLLSDNSVKIFEKLGVINKKILLGDLLSEKMLSDIVNSGVDINIVPNYFLTDFCCKLIFSENGLKFLKNGWLSREHMEEMLSDPDPECHWATLKDMLSDERGVQAVEKGWITFDEAIQYSRERKFHYTESLLKDGTMPSDCILC